MTTVYFDYACVFSYRLARLMDMAEVKADWRPFVLLQTKLAPDAVAVWDLVDRDLPINVLALAGHEFVAAQGGAGVTSYRQEAGRLFHESDKPPEARQIWHLIEKYTGHAKDELDLDGALERVKASHELAIVKRVFDTPTVYIGEGDKPYYIRLEAVPETVQSAKAIWKSLPKSAHHFPRPVIIKVAD